MLEFRRHWGWDYVAFLDEAERIVTIPIPWTDIEGEEDAFTVLSARRAYFRPADLLALADMIGTFGPAESIANGEEEARNV